MAGRPRYKGVMSLELYEHKRHEIRPVIEGVRERAAVELRRLQGAIAEEPDPETRKSMRYEIRCLAAMLAEPASRTLRAVRKMARTVSRETRSAEQSASQKARFIEIRGDEEDDE